MISCNCWTKVRLHGKKSGKSTSKTRVMTQKISRAGGTQTYSNYTRNKPKRPVSTKNIRPSKLVITIIKSIYQPDTQVFEKEIHQNNYYD